MSSSSSSSNSFQCLPHDVLELIASNMEAPDILSLVSTCRYLKTTLGDKASFWKNLLLQREGEGSPFSFLLPENNDNDDHSSVRSARIYKEQFLRAEFCRNLASLKWHAVDGTVGPTAREGHNCCLLGADHNLLVVTGGFTDDASVYIKDLRAGGSTTRSAEGRSLWQRIFPARMIPNQQFAYGSSLTRLNATTAVRFGGFQAGGYSQETSLVATLTITETHTDDNSPSFIAQWRAIPPRFADDDDDDTDTRNNNIHPSSWNSSSLNRHRGGRGHHHNNEEGTHHHHHGRSGFSLARAYHTATLLHNRYLFIAGGMQSRRGCSVLDPICLDCEIWTWILCSNNSANHLDVAATTSAAPSSLAAIIPSGRHGHSIVWDKFRSRLVLFGGGSGTDLLRSGRDNSEVWEFKAAAAAAPTSSDHTSSAAAAAAAASTVSSSPTPEEFLSKISSSQWRLIHQDQNDYYDRDGGDDDDDDNNNGAPGEALDHEVENGTSTATEASNSTTMSPINRLRPAETLNLGRCHAAHHVARDTVILLMGSGKPSTNSILAYNLQTDSFVRPNLNPSFLPAPRFTFASAFIPHLGCIFVHGGYSTQSSQSIAGMALLDLTPTLNKQAATASSSSTLDGNRNIRHTGITTTTSISPLRLFGAMGLHVPSFQPVTDQHVLDWHRVIRETHRHRQLRLFHFLAAMGQRVVVPTNEAMRYDSDDDDDDGDEP